MLVHGPNSADMARLEFLPAPAAAKTSQGFVSWPLDTILSLPCGEQTLQNPGHESIDPTQANTFNLSHRYHAGTRSFDGRG